MCVEGSGTELVLWIVETSNLVLKSITAAVNVYEFSNLKRFLAKMRKVPMFSITRKTYYSFKQSISFANR